MKIRVRKKSYGVTMFAMPDIAFLLLIFLILTVSVDEQGDINLPDFKFLQETDFPEIMSLNVTAAGEYGISGEIVDRRMLETSLDRLPETTVIHLIADKKSRYSQVDAVLQLLQEKQLLDVVLIMEEEKKAENE
ncbi:MAG: biopolymer transporter ExbD [Spirochaetales bacterium]|nr:biopolymer transporter ExbD [Spirochaetales bacterium]